MASGTNAKKPGQKAPSPFLVQYLALKEKHQENMLLFRMGDFYELFFEDAVEAANILNISLTSRGEYEGKPIPMAGVPHHSADSYIVRLIRSGKRVAICEQVESPDEARKRGSNAIVTRDVVRIVTPGTVTEDNLLDSRSSQSLAAIATTHGGDEAGIAIADVSTGAFEVFAVKPEDIIDAIAASRCSELLVTENEATKSTYAEFIKDPESAITKRPDRTASAQLGESLLKEAFSVSTLDAYGEFSKAELCACALLLEYIQITQAGSEARLDPPRRPMHSNVLQIDQATRASLEIDQSIGGNRKGSLLDTIDKTLTAPGARLLADRLSRPSAIRSVIQNRHEAISWLIDFREICSSWRSELKVTPDLERARSRLRLGRGGPKDLQSINKALAACEKISEACSDMMVSLPTLLSSSIEKVRIQSYEDLYSLFKDLTSALKTDLPMLVRDGNFIATGWDKKLDEIRELRENSRQIIARLQGRYIEQTKLTNLKIKHNSVHGYFVEVTAKQGDVLMNKPFTETFIHRQTLLTATRFTTIELNELATKIIAAEDETKLREKDLFDEFIERIESISTKLSEIAKAISEIDVACAAAVWAGDNDACRPEISDSSILETKGLRHPVVETALKANGEGFTANDVKLDSSGVSAPRLLLVTGPNMAGKSTYLRQTALSVILTQAGWWVPATKFKLGIADRLFSRVGASDDLARGRSTFMVEMVETAAILSQASERSVVIMDEVGRGTSTYDGLAIAWAAVEHLHNINKSRTLFATHYHELTSVVDNLKGASNVSLRAKEWKDELLFLHDVLPGPSDRSYGVHVARLAGLPKRAVQRAQQLLKRLESNSAPPDVLPLFTETTLEPEPEPDDLRLALEKIDPDQMSPRDALAALYDLKLVATKD